ncbi:uncharacterized protein LOC111272806 [Varroa jacobsoni]|uniref:uncharacterized protein LOC111272806 n=1 Tax=Varroa jacobsoni TaxID=62625 RepID=UPI000BF5DAE1|nr:uncharacterized protein LOC111272806 [Varroa jacobsoni]
MMLSCLRSRLITPLTIELQFIIAVITSAAPPAPLDFRCSLEPITGACRAAFLGFYFDTDSRKCKQFTYGGCGGNGFIFYCMEECDLVCVQRKNIKDFIERIEQILAANASDELNSSPIASLDGNTATHSTKSNSRHLANAYNEHIKQEDAPSGTLWLNPKPMMKVNKNEPTRTADGYRAFHDTKFRSKYICPLQEAFEAESLIDDVKDDQRGVTQSTTE